MNAIEIEAGPELDAAVANAIGLSGFIFGNPAWTFLVDARDHRDLFDRESLTNSTWGSDHSIVGATWSPSTDLDAAFEAAEKCGLFTRMNAMLRHCVSPKPTWQLISSLWPNLRTEGPSVAVAICRAILKLKGG